MSRVDVVNLTASTALTPVAAIRVALYGRYSSDLQNPKSVDAQFRVCREYAARHSAWEIVKRPPKEADRVYPLVKNQE